MLMFICVKVNKQFKSKEVNINNLFGCVFKVCDEYLDVDVEVFEFYFIEVILGEVFKLGCNLIIIKIIFVVVLFMGLLGMVIGMINIFQVIMLFGMGDLKLMVGGILIVFVIIVLGLVVVILMILFYVMFNICFKNIVYIL